MWFSSATFICMVTGVEYESIGLNLGMVLTAENSKVIEGQKKVRNMQENDHNAWLLNSSWIWRRDMIEQKIGDLSGVKRLLEPGAKSWHEK